MLSSAGSNTSPEASQALSIVNMHHVSKSRVANKIVRPLKDWLKGDKNKRASMIGSNDSVTGSLYMRSIKNVININTLLCVDSSSEADSDDENKPRIR